MLHAYGRFAEAVLAAADEVGDREVVVWTSPEQLRAGLADVQAVLGVGFPRLDWAGATRLRLIQLGGSGADGLLPAIGLPGSVAVANARGLSAPAMAEFALGSVLALAKRFPQALRHQAERRWAAVTPMILRGERAVVLGAGPVGTTVAGLLRAIGMTVVGVRRTAVPCPEFDEVFATGAIDVALAGASVVVVAVASTPETVGLLDEARLARCRPGCLLVNVARGDVVDEAAVGRLLRTGQLGGAALDVFATEPLPAQSPLWDAPAALLTPHVSWSTPGYEREVAALFVENVERIERDRPPRNAIDTRLGY